MEAKNKFMRLRVKNGYRVVSVTCLETSSTISAYDAFNMDLLGAAGIPSEPNIPTAGQEECPRAAYMAICPITDMGLRLNSLTHARLDFSASLADYFAAPRLLHEQDIFSVPIAAANKLPHFAQSHIFFKVVSIKLGAHADAELLARGVVQRDSTTLVQTGFDTSRRPIFPWNYMPEAFCAPLWNANDDKSMGALVCGEAIPLRLPQCSCLPPPSLAYSAVRMQALTTLLSNPAHELPVACIDALDARDVDIFVRAASMDAGLQYVNIDMLLLLASIESSNASKKHEQEAFPLGNFPVSRDVEGTLRQMIMSILHEYTYVCCHITRIEDAAHVLHPDASSSREQTAFIARCCEASTDAAREAVARKHSHSTPPPAILWQEDEWLDLAAPSPVTIKAPIEIVSIPSSFIAFTLRRQYWDGAPEDSLQAEIPAPTASQALTYVNILAQPHNIKVELGEILEMGLLPALNHLSWSAIKLAASYFGDGKPSVDAIGAGLKQATISSKPYDVEGLSTTSWEDIGGLKHAKNEIVELIDVPRKKLFGRHGRPPPRRGLLLFGPPGTGKTLLAKAIAKECKMSFMSVKGPEILDMYIGESEKKLRDVFAAARRQAPCLIFFDELDSLVPARGRSADSAAVMDRIVSTFITQLDALNSSTGLAHDPSAASLTMIVPSCFSEEQLPSSDYVFVLGATNRPDLLDSALLRPGRFDRMIYLGPPKTAASKRAILDALTRKFKLADDVDMAAVADCCVDGCTGADMYAVCARAWTAAARRYQREATTTTTGPHMDTTASHRGVQVSVCQQDFLDACAEVTPSVSPAELAEFERLRHHYKAISDD